MPYRKINLRIGLASLAVLALIAPPLAAQDRTLPQDKGAVGTWQKLLKLRTTASVMHITAHPDDEDAALLTWLSRGKGARVSLLTLTRGEGGDNKIGPELFDALGLLRTEELRNAGRYFGLDAQYFTSAIDFGFSKRLDETLEKWGHDEILGEVVRIIRIERPWIIISRFQGNAQDGHGNHQAAGLLAREAFDAAGDPKRFPGQIEKEHLRTWKPLKLYVGTGFFGGEKNATISVDTGVYSPWLGETYANFGRTGYASHRSQSVGRPRLSTGPQMAHYRRLMPGGAEPPKEADFFDGIETSLGGVLKAVREEEPVGLRPLLEEIDAQVRGTIATYRIDDPSASVTALIRALRATDAAILKAAPNSEAIAVLSTKKTQVLAAMISALGFGVVPVASPPDAAEPKGPFAMFAPPIVFGPVVPGESFSLAITLVNHGRQKVRAGLKAVHWRVNHERLDIEEPVEADLDAGRLLTIRVKATVKAGAELSRPEYRRQSVGDARYQLAHREIVGYPDGPPQWSVVGLTVDGYYLPCMVPVVRREANTPDGYVLRELEILPALAVNVSPRHAIVPQGGPPKPVDLKVELLNNDPAGSKGELALKLPEEWTSEPPTVAFEFLKAGERKTLALKVTPPADLKDAESTVEAVARVGDREYREGYEVIKHPDIETRYLFHSTKVTVRGVDVKLPGLKVGYVMGVGDQNPEGIRQLGVDVQLLKENDLAAGDLSKFDVIMTGTRAYAVREDLKTYNGRLLDYARAGGHLVVLYNTPEFVPDKDAPFPAALPGNAEEVSEEDSPVEILRPDDPVFLTPNRITAADFEGWIEQRGSKFFSQWDAAYTPLIATHDRGQVPQKGGWLTARYGQGRYTYFAYALHRQLPYGVAGAYRILANLLSQDRAKPE